MINLAQPTTERETVRWAEAGDTFRSQLAVDRTLLAAETTYAAWLRTGLGALASALGSRALPGHVLPTDMVSLLSLSLLALCAFCLVAAVWRELMPIAQEQTASVRRLPKLMLIGVNGILLTVTLLIGVVWIG